MKFLTLAFKTCCWFGGFSLLLAGVEEFGGGDEFSEALAFLFLGPVVVLLPSVVVLEETKPRED